MKSVLALALCVISPGLGPAGALLEEPEGPIGRSYSAVVVGSTGASGRAIVMDLMQDARCTRVHALVRQGRSNRTLSVQDLFGEVRESEKFKVVEVDFEDLRPEDFRADVVFSALGYSVPRAADHNLDWKMEAASSGGNSYDNPIHRKYLKRVDVDYCLAAARAAQEAGVKHFQSVGAAGDNPNAPRMGFSWYNRIKGKGDVEVMKLHFPLGAVVTKPGMLNRGELFGDYAPSAWNPIMRFVHANYITVEQLARASVREWEHRLDGQVSAANREIEEPELRRLGK